MAARVTLSIGLCILVVLSGCVGGGKAKSPPSASISATGPIDPNPSAKNEPDCVANPTAKECVKSNDPKRHYHHYWGEPPLPQVDIFYDDNMEFLWQQPFAGPNEGCNTVGVKEFTLEDDEDDSSPPDGKPVNLAPQKGDNPKADVIFAGTSRIEARLLKLDVPANAAGAYKVFLQWKPANLNHFIPDSDSCGIPLQVSADSVGNITVGRGASDPPHQWFVSRWAFRVWVIAEVGEGGTQAPAVGTAGKFGIRLTAINGGENSLDPAHPDLWAGSAVYDLGCTKVDSVPRQFVMSSGNDATSGFDRQPQEPLTNIQLQYGRIVPLLTEKITGTLTYEYKGSTPGTSLELLYHGADSSNYGRPDEVKGAGTNKQEFTINDPNGLKADPPYLAQTQWRFELVPHNSASQPDQASLADFEGSYEICAQAHRDLTKELT